MTDARDVARHLVRVGYSPESPEESTLLCQLRLQKLLYYCQGWGYALTGGPLFHQTIGAWPKGPVVKDVYQMFKGRKDGIRPEEAGEPGPMAETTIELIRMVWREYAKYTPGELIAMTHGEPAWKEARQGLAADERTDRTLSPETMAAYFKEQAKKLSARKDGFPAVDPAELWQADLQLERAGYRGIPADEAFRRAKASRRS